MVDIARSMLPMRSARVAQCAVSTPGIDKAVPATPANKASCIVGMHDSEHRGNSNDAANYTDYHLY